jgi:hypothetical protein
MTTVWIAILNGEVQAVFYNWKSACKYREEFPRDENKMELVCKVVSN